MGREVKRVPLDFAWPLEKRWEGYTLPHVPCPACGTKPQREDCKDCYGEGIVAADRVHPPVGEGWQVWETVSEGSPVTPVFGTAEELARYLSEHGDSWAQKRARREWPLPTYEQALAFVTAGWAPSAVFANGHLLDSYQAAAVLKTWKENA